MHPEELKEEKCYIKETKNGLIRHKPEVIEEIRRKHNMDNEENREIAIAVINDWIQQQEHFMKKDFSKDYIERCIIASNGSIERAKKQIDKMCTFRTLMPDYFRLTDIRKSELMSVFNMAEIAMVPKLTENHYRVLIVKYKKNAVIKSSHDYVLLFRMYTFIADYLQNYEYCLGFCVLYDLYDANVADILPKVNLFDLQRTYSILTQGYGCKFKEIYAITGSKFMESFIKLLRAMFSEKIMNRLHCVPSREEMKKYMKVESLPKEYGGSEMSTKELTDLLIQTITDESVPEVMKEMQKAKTDESKRETHKFNEEIMGMPGSFRNVTLD